MGCLFFDDGVPIISVSRGQIVKTYSPGVTAAAIPAVPKVLGLSGLIPFYALSPPLVKYVGEVLAATPYLLSAGDFLLHDLLPYAAMLQIGYGSAIVSFLGAVHWGAAMQSRTGVRFRYLCMICLRPRL